MDRLQMIVARLHARRPGADQGATVVEYCLLAALVLGLCLAAVSLLGGHAVPVLSGLADRIAAW
ncbi:Flp family type IVb pilin [Actinoplanes teichomyceticus]|uniref:Pilus assembly protein Flp/PilA n=1 Tax=Actinoplanes teichomyceticus TaxID=1867 RepID=A0A561WK01_ACTTI|nr:Flp family type IVb pilin [Actinoplanes teichomyceticus]TWG24192.1 hypothetical protein FHX34_102745 [Actinoplanes teichomyceticus]GIF12961.1 hypothetical protein Ate01nite_29930 [Actinoplanes teichomyceticus]